MTSARSSGRPARTDLRPEPTRAQRMAVWLGLCAVPLIWLLHLALGVTLVSTACADVVAQDAPTWRDTHRILGIASVCALGGRDRHHFRGRPRLAKNCLRLEGKA
ncbi:hypothetical protein [Paraburkholderia lycopersici]|uniref:Uncharacterized protein n=1 Tax=Paraburkholderia lycopersici TaxID=416944 RepID=A0A1G6X6Z6_9BURK|nr:hypothetical protein [Paraburkholderia lycopersici]SDD73940.1 hypothetical protein SAMN05421548_12496 [Paraburkholderia lycopersici]